MLRRPVGRSSRPRARAVLAVVLCSLALTAACTDVIEEPAPPTGSVAPTGVEQRRPEGGGEVRPSGPTEPTRRPTTVPPTTRSTTTTAPYYPPTSCPPGLVC